MSDLGTDRVRASATIPTTTDSGQLVPMIVQTHQVTQRRLNEVLVDAGSSRKNRPLKAETPRKGGKEGAALEERQLGSQVSP
jgi:hypothetical protein